jgi:hypothetical protein
VSFLQAAQTVLREAGKPLTTAEVATIAIERGLVATSGKTPVATMRATLYGAPAESGIRREFSPGPTRAKRDSVRWRYVEKRR